MTPAFPPRIILSRTDNLGDVILTLPMAGFIKQHAPATRVYFIGKAYTRPLIEACVHVDEFLDREALLTHPALLRDVGAGAIVFVFPDRPLAELAARVGIPVRVGTSHRWFHWRYANRLVNLSRRHAHRHEAELNVQLLKPLGLSFYGGTEQLADWYGLTKIPVFSRPDVLKPNRFHLILHPKSKGSAREWPLEKYYALAEALSPDFQVLITGTTAEGELIRQQKPELLRHPLVTDLTGQFSLGELMGLIAAADGLVAGSTGPLHIAAALGKFALGIYPPIRPLHPGRWAPVGKKATYVCLEKACDDCRKTGDCACIRAIDVAQVRKVVESWR
ncbi:MAG: glycosyltransferase family 9 protein [Ferruginibacter sp.]|nr:glycosyltransferase family 9 protein [Cytophagales bacterium]